MRHEFDQIACPMLQNLCSALNLQRRENSDDKDDKDQPRGRSDLTAGFCTTGLRNQEPGVTM